MAPEQLRGGHVDHRADIFAFGAVLYEMITGRKAFHGDTFLSAVIAVREEQPPSLSTGDSPRLEALDNVVRRCLAKDPAARWQSADELERALFEVMAIGTAEGSAPAKGAPRRIALTWSLAALLALAAGSHDVAAAGASGADDRPLERRAASSCASERAHVDRR